MNSISLGYPSKILFFKEWFLGTKQNISAYAQPKHLLFRTVKDTDNIFQRTKDQMCVGCVQAEIWPLYFLIRSEKAVLFGTTRFFPANFPFFYEKKAFSIFFFSKQKINLGTLICYFFLFKYRTGTFVDFSELFVKQIILDFFQIIFIWITECRGLPNYGSSSV